jgi:hypothetical protein
MLPNFPVVILVDHALPRKDIGFGERWRLN